MDTTKQAVKSPQSAPTTTSKSARAKPTRRAGAQTTECAGAGVASTKSNDAGITATARAKKDAISKAARTSKGATRPRPRSKEPKPASGVFRSGSKGATIVALLKRKNGATIAELVKTTGWQAHSVRGFLSGSLKKKLGIEVASEKGDDGQRRYQIES